MPRLSHTKGVGGVSAAPVWTTDRTYVDFAIAEWSRPVRQSERTDIDTREGDDGDEVRVCCVRWDPAGGLWG